MNQDIIQYGHTLLENHPSILKTRQTYQIDNYNGFSEKLLKEILNEMNIFDFDDYQYLLKVRNHREGYCMKWHVDDACISNTCNNTYDENDFEFITHKKLLYYKDSSMKPKYTIMLYESDYNDDFTGGELEFVDGTLVYPSVGKCVLFDAREVHRMRPILSGVRTSILLKFY